MLFGIDVITLIVQQLEKLIDDTMIVFKKSCDDLANSILCRAVDKK